jgi:hypothetical protein
MLKLLSKRREILRTLSKEEKDKYMIHKFKEKCLNMHEVINVHKIQAQFEEEDDDDVCVDNDCENIFCSPQKLQKTEEGICSPCSNQPLVESNKQNEFEDEFAKLIHLGRHRLDSSKFSMKWIEPLTSDEIYSLNVKGINIVSLDMCRESFCFLYGISVDCTKRVSKRMREQQTTDILRSHSVGKINHDTYLGSQTDRRELEIFKDNALFDLSLKHQRLALLRGSQAHLDAYNGMEK